MRPFALGRHHVLVAHEKYRLFGAFTLPIEKQISVDLCLFKLFVNKRKELFKHLVKTEEFINLRYIRVRGCIVLNHFRKLFGKAKRFLLVLIRLVIGFFLRHEKCAN